MGKRRRRSRKRSSWQTEIGGVPVWVIWAAAAVLVGMVAIPVAVSSTPQAKPYVRPSDALLTEPAKVIPRAVAWGDSWFNGADGIPAEEAFGYLALRGIGFATEVGGHGGTGYVTNEPIEGGAPNYVDQIAEDGFPIGGKNASEVQVVVIEGGINDYAQDPVAVKSNATAVIAAAKARYPAARVVVLGPPARGGSADQIASVTDAIRSAAAEAGVDFVDMGPWVTPENADSIIGDVSSHPDREGFQILAGMLTSALQALGVAPVTS